MSVPANAWYVETTGSPGSSGSQFGMLLRRWAARIGCWSGGSVEPSTPAFVRSSRIRTSSSFAAFFVNVSPSTSSGFTCPVQINHTTRAAIAVVFPDPAPATITPGANGAVIAANC
jgi:hypothetical protein